jgi:glycosyltransferase involved in cell wall biosynthesis
VEENLSIMYNMADFSRANNDGYRILYFGNDWHAENKTSSHHIAEELSGMFSVTYVECPGLRTPTGSGRDLLKLFRKIALLMKGKRIVHENLCVFTQPKVPLYGLPGISWFNERLSSLFVKMIRGNVPHGKGIAFFLIPHAYGAMEGLQDYFNVYYCIDEYSSLPGVDPDAVSLMDRRMMEKADMVFIASKELYERRRDEYPQKHIVHSPHGVDYEHFQENRFAGNPPPESIEGLKRPIIGFFGLIERWIDLELVQYMAERKPDWSFLMIGKLLVDLPPGLLKRKNVYFPGFVPYAEIPNYARWFDAAVLPYRLNRQVLNSNPKKLREYLALGKPIVSVRYPEVEQFSDLVEIADGYEDFLIKLEKAVSTDSPEKAVLRRQRVAPYTWTNRVVEIFSQVNEAIKEKHNE